MQWAILYPLNYNNYKGCLEKVQSKAKKAFKNHEIF